MYIYIYTHTFTRLSVCAPRLSLGGGGGASVCDDDSRAFQKCTRKGR